MSDYKVVRPHPYIVAIRGRSRVGDADVAATPSMRVMATPPVHARELAVLSNGGIALRMGWLAELEDILSAVGHVWAEQGVKPEEMARVDLYRVTHCVDFAQALVRGHRAYARAAWGASSTAERGVALTDTEDGAFHLIAADWTHSWKEDGSVL